MSCCRRWWGFVRVCEGLYGWTEELERVMRGDGRYGGSYRCLNSYMCNDSLVQTWC